MMALLNVQRRNSMKLTWMSIVIVQALALSARAAKLPDIYWNMSNPIFRIDNTDHIFDVNRGNTQFEYDQVNIVCPKHDPNVPTEDTENYIIYNVSKEEYETCSIRDLSRAKIIAQCNKPYQSMCFTITFRSFTPQPGGLEFKPGNDYFFIAAPENVRQGENHCLTKNMKVQFKVCCKNEAERRWPTHRPSSTTSSTTTPNNDENSIYPFYPVPTTMKPTRRPHHASHRPHHSVNTHEASTINYVPYPNIRTGPSNIPRLERPHHKWTYTKTERPAADDTAAFKKAQNTIARRGRPWEHAANKAGLTNAASTLHSTLAVAGLTLLVTIARCLTALR